MAHANSALCCQVRMHAKLNWFRKSKFTRQETMVSNNYKQKATLKHTSRISSVGICGKKSLPTKKQMKIKSSIMHSKSISKGRLGILISYSRYSRRVQMFRNCKQGRVSIISIYKHESMYNALSYISAYLIRLFRHNFSITFLIKFSCLSLCLPFAICS